MGNDNASNGWRVLATDPRGPCKDANLIPFFDYIIGINGKRLDGCAVSMKEELESALHKPTELTILDYKTNKTRSIEVCPSQDWGGVGLLGLIIANDDYKTADERTVRVLNVFNDSPAQNAGLHPFVDYILGTENKIFNGIDGFEGFILSSEGIDVRLRVYNSNLRQVREVILRPSRDWGNEEGGLLGCEVGSGLLHKIPDLLPGNKITAHPGTMAEFVMSGTGILVTPPTVPSTNETPGQPADPDKCVDADDLGPMAFGTTVGSIYDAGGKMKANAHGSDLVRSVERRMSENTVAPPQPPVAAAGLQPQPPAAAANAQVLPPAVPAQFDTRDLQPPANLQPPPNATMAKPMAVPLHTSAGQVPAAQPPSQHQQSGAVLDG